MPAKTDEECAALVRRAQRGDRRALEDLLGQFRPRIFRYCLARLGEREEAEDVTQETCLALTDSLDGYRDFGKPFSAFVFGIASNKVRMARRGRGRRLEVVQEAVPDEPAAGPGPELLAVADDQLRRLLSRLDVLSERQRNILILRVVAGLTSHEVAAALDLRVGTVRVAQHRGLAALRRDLSDTETGRRHE